MTSKALFCVWVGLRSKLEGVFTGLTPKTYILVYINQRLVLRKTNIDGQIGTQKKFYKAIG